MVGLSAMGAEVVVSGWVAVGFGQVSSKTADPETTSLDGVGEGGINVSAEADAFSGQVEWVVAEAGTMDAIEHELVWAITDTLSLTMSGRSFGIESQGGNIGVVNAPGGPVGDEGAEIDFADTGLLNVEFAAGPVTVGLALLDDCVPECGYALDGAGGTVATTDERQTGVVHFRGEFGGLAFNGYMAGSSGSWVDSTPATPVLEAGAGSGSGIGLSFDGGSFTVGFDASTETNECSTPITISPDTCESDIEMSRTGVSFTAAGLGAHYVTTEETLGTEISELTNIDVVYLFEVGDAVVGPEYRVVSTQNTAGGVKGEKLSDSFALFGMSMEF